MGRSPCHDQDKGVKKGPWMPEEDEKLTVYINKNGYVKWRSLPKLAGLNRCGKSCRLRWMNYLRPDIRRGEFSDEEESTIVKLHALLGNKWSKIASQLPGRTDNEIKNYWNTHMRKKLLQMGIDPMTHEPRTNDLSSILGVSQLLATAINNGQFGNSNFFNNNNNTALEDLLKLQLIQKMLQIITPKAIPNINNVNTTSLNSKPESAAGQLDAIGQQVFINQSANIWDGLEDNQLPSLVTFSREKLNTAKPDASTTTDQTRVGMMAGYEISSSDSVWVCPEISSMNHPGTTQQSSGFEDWEKFLDDGTSDSCWKSFLDLTSPTSSTVPW